MRIWEVGFGVLAGLVLFLYGIEHFSREIQTVTGSRFRAWIGALTKSPLRGAVLGAATTMLIQSSSATTVIAVGLVNAGTISFAASLGIICGANVGTTLTAQLVALEVTAFAPVFMVLGFGVSLAGGRLRFLGRPLFYFGLVFFALGLVSNALEPVRADPRVPEIFARYSSVPMGLLAGFLVTLVVQSSSVTTGIVVLLAAAGVVTMDQAVPILLGANLGTTTTTLLASVGMSLHARRVSVAHLMFNVGGVLLFLPVLGPFTQAVADLGGGPAQQVANAHLIFNGVAAVVFLIALRPLKALVERLVRGDEDEILFETRFLGKSIPEDTAYAFAAIEAELRYLLEVTIRLYEAALHFIRTPTPRYMRVTQKLEELIDFLDERIEEALIDLSRRALEHPDAERVVLLVRLSSQLEQIGDTGLELAELVEAIEYSGEQLPKKTIDDLERAGAVLHRTFEVVHRHFPLLPAPDSSDMHDSQTELRRIVNDGYAAHVRRIAAEDRYPGAAVVDALSKFEAASNQLREIRRLLEAPPANGAADDTVRARP